MFQVPPVDPQQQRERALAMARKAHDDALRSGRIGMLVGGAVFLLVGASAIVAAVSMLLDDVSLGGLAGAVLFAFAFTGGSLLFFGVARSLRRREELRTRGVPTQVRIIEVVPGGGAMRISSGRGGGGISQSVLRLEVLLPTGGSAVVVHREFAPYGAHASMRPGAVLSAFMDPKKPAKLLLDWPS